MKFEIFYAKKSNLKKFNIKAELNQTQPKTQIKQNRIKSKYQIKLLKN